MNPMSLTLGWLAGKRMARLAWEAGGSESDRVRAYLYNGVKLPQLPDKGMPYALMELDKNEKYHVWLCNAPIHTSNIGVLLVPSGSAGYHYMVSDDGVSWKLREDWGLADSTRDSPFAWPNNAVWADYDVLENDGTTVRLSASNPVPLYSYNGVELPELPEWDRVTYPYAYIGKAPWFGILDAYTHYVLRVSNAPIRCTVTVRSDGSLAPDGWNTHNEDGIAYYARYIEYRCPADSMGWSYYSTEERAFGETHKPLWTNTDMDAYTYDGAGDSETGKKYTPLGCVGLEASDPRPVYL